MKKLLMLFLMACLASSAFAQENPRNSKNPFVQMFGEKNLKESKMDDEAAVDVSAGVNSSTLPVSNSDNNSKSLIGFHAGFGTPVYHFSKSMGLRSGLIYSQQGDKSSYGESGYYSSSSETRLNYLYMPITARYQNSNGFFAETGLQPGLLLSARRKTTSSGMGGSSNGTADIKNELNSFDLSIPIGVGYIFKKKIAISARAIPGLSNVNKKAENGDTPKKRNMVISARLSYLL